MRFSTLFIALLISLTSFSQACHHNYKWLGTRSYLTEPAKYSSKYKCSLCGKDSTGEMFTEKPYSHDTTFPAKLLWDIDTAYFRAVPEHWQPQISSDTSIVNLIVWDSTHYYDIHSVIYDTVFMGKLFYKLDSIDAGYARTTVYVIPNCRLVETTVLNDFTVTRTKEYLDDKNRKLGKNIVVINTF